MKYTTLVGQNMLTIMGMLPFIWDWVAELLWPTRCAVCGRIGAPACTACLAALQPLTPQRCPACQRPSRLGLPCPACRGRSHLDRIVAATSLEPASEAFVYAFKYRGVRTLAGPLAQRMCDIALRMSAATTLFAETPIIIPVPLHPRRLRERGFNQAELLAHRISMISAMSVRTDILTRTRVTHQQAIAASKADRRENMRGAFSASHADGLHILLIDDVTTTGATLEDCARALKEAGATSVSALTFAHG